MRGRDADEPAPHVLRTNDIDAAGSVAAAGRPPSHKPIAMSAGRASRADGRKRLAGSGSADGVPEGGGAAAPHRRHHGANDMDPQTIEKAIKQCIDISTRLGALEDELPPAPGASSSSAWTTSTKCSDGWNAASELARGWPGGRFGCRAAPKPSPRPQARRWQIAPASVFANGPHPSERSTTTTPSAAPDLPGHQWPEPRFRPWLTSSPPTAPCHPPGRQRQRWTRVSALTR